MRRVALLVCVMVPALVGATGVALAAAQNGIEDNTIGEVPLRRDQPSVDFVPGQVVVEKYPGEYEIRKVDAQKLNAVKEAAKEIEAENPSVQEAGPNFIYDLGGFAPNDPYFVQQDWLWNDDPNIVAIRARGAWDDSKGSGVRIGVVDTGWQIDHPDLVDKVARQRDFVVDDPDPTKEDPVAEGYDYHGTSVAGVAAADTNNNQGVASIGFNARFVMAKACTNVCKTLDTAPAIDWLAQQMGVKIINLSFGAELPDGTTDQILGEALGRAQEAGALVVASAGNRGVDTDNHYPSCFEGVLGIGAVSDNGRKASFSNTGPCVDLVAPGESLTTTFDENDPIIVPGTPYASVGGTSFSAPQVAGTAALIMAGNQDLSAEQIAKRLENHARDRGVAGRDDIYGYGLLDARCSVGPADTGC